MANNPFGAVPQQNMSAPTGQIQGGNFAAPHPFNAGSGTMQRNWGATTNPPQQDSMLAQGINAWMMNPANPNNYYNYRAGRSGGGRGFWGRGKKQQQQQQGPQDPTSDSSIKITLNQNPTFGDQSNLGVKYFGGGAPGQQFQQPQPVGQNPAGQQPAPGRQPRVLTPEQKARNNETARARRALAADIKKNGTAEQQQRIQQEGVAGGKTRQPRQPKTASQSQPPMQPPAATGTNTNTSADTNYAPQTYAPRNTFGSAPQGTSGTAGAPFLTLPGITGGTAKSGTSSAQGANIGRLTIN